MMKIRCTGAWVKGARLRGSCGWSAEVDDPARPAHLAKPGGLQRNRWASCPRCGGSVTFEKIGWIQKATGFLGDQARHFAGFCGR